jgi:hypothetical protein
MITLISAACWHDRLVLEHEIHNSLKPNPLPPEIAKCWQRPETKATTLFFKDSKMSCSEENRGWSRSRKALKYVFLGW